MFLYTTLACLAFSMRPTSVFRGFDNSDGKIQSDHHFCIPLALQEQRESDPSRGICQRSANRFASRWIEYRTCVLSQEGGCTDISIRRAWPPQGPMPTCNFPERFASKWSRGGSYGQSYRPLLFYRFHSLRPKFVSRYTASVPPPR